MRECIIGNDSLERVDTFAFLGTELLEDGDFSRPSEIRKHLMIGRWQRVGSDLKVPGCLLCHVEALVFSMILYGCETWTIRKPESTKINAFEL